VFNAKICDTFTTDGKHPLCLCTINPYAEEDGSALSAVKINHMYQ